MHKRRGSGPVQPRGAVHVGKLKQMIWKAMPAYDYDIMNRIVALRCTGLCLGRA